MWGRASSVCLCVCVCACVPGSWRLLAWTTHAAGRPSAHRPHTEGDIARGCTVASLRPGGPSTDCKSSPRTCSLFSVTSAPPLSLPDGEEDLKATCCCGCCCSCCRGGKTSMELGAATAGAGCASSRMAARPDAASSDCCCCWHGCGLLLLLLPLLLLLHARAGTGRCCGWPVGPHGLMRSGWWQLCSSMPCLCHLRMQAVCVCACT